jgi:NADH dehydrogenase
MVQDIQQGRVIFENDEIEAGNIIWTAGVGAPKLTREMEGVELDKAGRITVDPQLSIPNFPETFAIGDIAKITDADGKPVPGISPAAIQAGEYLAKLLARQIREGEKGREAHEGFEYFDKGYMATIGRSAAVARLGNDKLGQVKFSGFLAWLAWLFVHLIFLIGFRNRVIVMIQWFYSYIAYRRGSRIIFGDFTRKDFLREKGEELHREEEEEALV